jgi:hypothetical protein|tara:strand:+ start:2380 stop:2721 length:342 start_codon:yes stop_codon:yes gene_type:complete
MTETVTEQPKVSEWDFYGACENGELRRYIFEFEAREKKELVEHNGRYAIMNTNGGYITVSGKVLPESIKTDEDAIFFAKMLSSYYVEGKADGVNQNQRDLIDVLGLKKHIKHL